MIAQNAALERPSRIDRLVLSATVAGKPGNVPMSPAALQLMQSPDPAAKEELMKLFFSKKNREPQNWPTVSAAITTSASVRDMRAASARVQLHTKSMLHLLGAAAPGAGALGHPFSLGRSLSRFPLRFRVGSGRQVTSPTEGRSCGATRSPGRGAP